MPGLGTRLLGAALAGYGTGIVSEAKNRRDSTLLNLRCKWQVEDRDTSAALTREGWERADERTDRTIAAADARADAAVHPFIDEDGVTRYGRHGDVVGERAPTKTPTSEPLVKVKRDGKIVWLPRSQARGMAAPDTGKEERLYPIEDPRTGATIGYQTREEALGKTQGSRFSDPRERYAVLYAPDTVRCAFWEPLGRNHFAQASVRLAADRGRGPAGGIDILNRIARRGRPARRRAGAHRRAERGSARRQPRGGPYPVCGRPCPRAGSGRIFVPVALHGRYLRGRVRPVVRQAESARLRRAYPPWGGLDALDDYDIVLAGPPG